MSVLITLLIGGVFLSLFLSGALKYIRKKIKETIGGLIRKGYILILKIKGRKTTTVTIPKELEEKIKKGIKSGNCVVRSKNYWNNENKKNRETYIGSQLNESQAVFVMNVDVPEKEDMKKVEEGKLIKI